MLDPAGVEAFVDGFMTAYLEEAGAVGGVVAIVENGHIVLAKGYGEDDRARNREVEARRTLFRVGSVSKLFVWTAVMQLVERGKVDLDADVNRYLEGVEVPATFKEPVTLAHLMTHTAGFEDHVLGLFAHDANAVRPLRELLAAELPGRVRAPGAVAAYSNHGAALAMLVVEQVSGMPWTEYVETQILGPLGMKRTTFRQPVPEALRDDVSIGYRNPGGEPEAADFEYVPLAPAGAMSSTATDMARFMLAHLGSGQLGDARILSQAAARRMHRTLHRHDPAVPGMAHGFIESDRNGRRVIGHGGDTLWFHTALELYPEQGIGIFASFNTAGAEPQKLTKAFADRYFAPAEWTPQLRGGGLDRTRAPIRRRLPVGALLAPRPHQAGRSGVAGRGERRRLRRAGDLCRRRACAGSRSSRWSFATRRGPRRSHFAKAGAAASRTSLSARCRYSRSSACPGTRASWSTARSRVPRSLCSSPRW